MTQQKLSYGLLVVLGLVLLALVIVYLQVLWQQSQSVAVPEPMETASSTDQQTDEEILATLESLRTSPAEPLDGEEANDEEEVVEELTEEEIVTALDSLRTAPTEPLDGESTEESMTEEETLTEEEIVADLETLQTPQEEISETDEEPAPDTE